MSLSDCNVASYPDRYSVACPANISIQMKHLSLFTMTLTVLIYCRAFPCHKSFDHKTDVGPDSYV